MLALDGRRNVGWRSDVAHGVMGQADVSIERKRRAGIEVGEVLRRSGNLEGRTPLQED